MIGLLHGRLLDRQPPVLMLDVNGVGYEVSAPMTTFYDLPDNGAEVTLYTHLAIRDDAHVLYGFRRQSDRELFRTLIKVNGVGPKLALTILSGMDGDAFARCVQEQDAASLTRLPGVGKRTAERLVVELRDRLGDAALSGSAPVAGEAEIAPVSPVEEAVSALVALGYKPQEASRMVRGVDAGQLSSEQIIRQALQDAVG